MIRMIQSRSAQAKSYFSESLAKGDYFINNQEEPGIYGGKLAARLGLFGHADKKSFHALCDNKCPNTGKTLTPRTKEGRTTGYDFNLHAPKSFSILALLSKDDHLINIFRESVDATLNAVETDILTRVRKDNKNEDRIADELLFVKFLHKTARPVDGMPPDPHLHTHAFIFNMSYDKKEECIKAGQFREIQRSIPFYRALFNKHLTDRLVKSGYQVEQRGNSFEICGIPHSVIRHFSKRTDAIGRVAKELGITNARELSELGARTRAKKQKNLSIDELKANWREQIIAHGYDKEETGQAIRSSYVIDNKDITAEKCVDHSILHAFERSSVVSSKSLQETALRYAMGNSKVSPDDICRLIKEDSRIISVEDKSQILCTTREVLAEEKRMISIARSGFGAIKPLYNKAPELSLKDQQAAAVTHILTTADRISIVTGKAGVGKTHLMKEAKDKIEAAGKQMIVLAPTADASRSTLRDEGFTEAETVALFLGSKDMQKKIAGNVLWIDEAGLLGVKDTAELLHIAKEQNAQVIFGGDTRQHAAVVRGDALRILSSVAQIKSAEVNKIYRQKNVEYRKAVASISKGDLKDGFNRLDAMGSIQKVDHLKPNEQLVKDYVAAVKKGKDCLVISPTHQQGEEVTKEIRHALREEQLLGKEEILIIRLKNLNYTEAEKSDWRNFMPGQTVQFVQNVKGIKRGSAWQVAGSSKEAVYLKDKTDKVIALPDGKAKCFDVLEPQEMALSVGDKIKVTRNGFDKNEKKLNNGQIAIVESIAKDGTIIFRNPVSKTSYAVDKNYSHLSHAHCVTSHASQGKTVDEVFIYQPAGTFGATGAKQFYVSASRGREKVTFYTDDKVGLLEHVQRIGDRQSAHELIMLHNQHITQMEIEKEKTIIPEYQREDKYIARDEWEFEPEL